MTPVALGRPHGCSLGHLLGGALHVVFSRDCHLVPIKQILGSALVPKDVPTLLAIVGPIVGRHADLIIVSHFGLGRLFSNSRFIQVDLLCLLVHLHRLRLVVGVLVRSRYAEVDQVLVDFLGLWQLLRRLDGCLGRLGPFLVRARHLLLEDVFLAFGYVRG